MSRHYSHRRTVAPFEVPGEDVGRPYVTDRLWDALLDCPPDCTIVARDSGLGEWADYCPSCERITFLEGLYCRKCT